jgi:prefoldin subunit 5
MENSQKNIQKEQEENLAIGQQILSQLIQMNKYMSSLDNNITKLNTRMERMDNNITKLNTRMERMEGKIDRYIIK